MGIKNASQNTIFVYDPEYGFSAPLEFGSSAVDFKQNENGDFIAVTYSSIQSQPQEIKYRTLYKLEKSMVKLYASQTTWTLLWKNRQ